MSQKLRLRTVGLGVLLPWPPGFSPGPSSKPVAPAAFTRTTSWRRRHGQFQGVCAAPAYCAACKKLEILNYLDDDPKCAACAGKPVFYNDRAPGKASSGSQARDYFFLEHGQKGDVQPSNVNYSAPSREDDASFRPERILGLRRRRKPHAAGYDCSAALAFYDKPGIVKVFFIVEKREIPSLCVTAHPEARATASPAAVSHPWSDRNAGRRRRSLRPQHNLSELPLETISTSAWADFTVSMKASVSAVMCERLATIRKMPSFLGPQPFSGRDDHLETEILGPDSFSDFISANPSHAA